MSYSHHHTASAITSESLWFEQRDLIVLRYVSLVTSGLYQSLNKLSNIVLLPVFISYNYISNNIIENHINQYKIMLVYIDLEEICP